SLCTTGRENSSESIGLHYYGSVDGRHTQTYQQSLCSTRRNRRFSEKTESENITQRDTSQHAVTQLTTRCHYHRSGREFEENNENEE
ncbi:hypothetical protein PFISCL1PPCAC_15085, partial [Pristionchus fissidentatus]